jgi:hypothetical protein
LFTGYEEKVKFEVPVEAKNIAAGQINSESVATDNLTAKEVIGERVVATGDVVIENRVSLKSLANKWEAQRQVVIFYPNEMKKAVKSIFTMNRNGNRLCGTLLINLEYMNKNEEIVNEYFIRFDIYCLASDFAAPSGHTPVKPLFVTRPTSNKKLVIKNQWGSLDGNNYSLHVAEDLVTLHTNQTQRRYGIINGHMLHRCTVEFIGSL